MSRSSISKARERACFPRKGRSRSATRGGAISPRQGHEKEPRGPENRLPGLDQVPRYLEPDLTIDKVDTARTRQDVEDRNRQKETQTCLPLVVRFIFPRTWILDSEGAGRMIAVAVVRKPREEAGD